MSVVIWQWRAAYSSCDKFGPPTGPTYGRFNRGKSLVEALGTELAKVMELQDEGTTLFVKAGIGWEPGVVGQVKLKVEKTSSEGYALATDKPVISNDIAREKRFTYADFILDHGVRALVNVPIRQPNGGYYGILQVDSRVPRDFDDRDVGFLCGYANLLGAAVSRIVQAEALRQSQAALLESEATLRQTQNWRRSASLLAVSHTTSTTS